ncbi:dihydrofolate reductase [Vibrio sp. JCM 18904]|nr:dihydrofolate reductase [Vibrio sp. JCM 18904]
MVILSSQIGGDEFKETYSEMYQADEKNAYNMRFTVLEK